ncbi:MarR family [Pyrobaculum sp. WP30]|nr:MarR family [Pyrobaculum sp. WP30]
MLWVLLLFANGTALMMLNATVAVPIFNVTLPAEPAWGPVVKLDGVPVPALVDGRRVSVVTGGGGVVTIEYVPRLVDVGGVPAVNITTQDLLLIWANGSLLVMPTVKILNFTRLNHSLVIVARGPGYVAYATPLANAATQTTATTAAQPTRPQTNTATQPTTAVQTTTRQETPQPSAAITTPPQMTSTVAWMSTPQTPPPTQAAQPGASAPGAFDAWWPVAAAAAAGAALVAAYLGRRRPVELGEVGEVDAKILEYVRRRGGAYEADVARELGIPRTTVFRAVRRLEERGLVRVEKREGRNWVAPAG